MKLRTLVSLGLTVTAALWLFGCGAEGNKNSDTLGADWTLTQGATPKVFANFNLGSMPMPNDVVWRMYDTDPGVELPASPNDSPLMTQLKAAVSAMGNDPTNPLLGLSNNMFLTVPVTGAVDADDLDFLVINLKDPNLGSLLMALSSQPPNMGNAIVAYGNLEKYGVDDFLAVNDGGVIKLLPKKPFKPGGFYAVAVKATLTDMNGYAVESDLGMQMLKSTTPIPADSPFYKLESVRQAFNDFNTSTMSPGLFDVVKGVTTVVDALDGTLDGTAWTRNDILVMWTFNTATKTLDMTATGTMNYPDDDSDPFSQTNGAFKGLSGVFSANSPTLASTLTGPALTAFFNSIGAPSSALGSVYFGSYTSPKLTYGTNGATDTVPFLLATPPGDGFPVILFQHGLTSKKEDVFGIVNTYASMGFAVLAIDAPLHGARTVQGGSSGDGYFTDNLLQNRANLYQSAIDLWEAMDMIDNGSLAGALDVDLYDYDVKFSTLSLGSIIASVFLNQEDRVSQMHLAAPSAMMVNVLDESSMPTLTSLVGSLGYTKGTTSYYVFLNLAQWLLDPIDPAYMGIGENSTYNLMAVLAYDDPIVSTNSARVFLTNLGLDLDDIVAVDPDGASGNAFPLSSDYQAGAYEYGYAGHPVIHTWLLSPSISSDAAATYYAGYDPVYQLKATQDVQAQAAGFFYFGSDD